MKRFKADTWFIMPSLLLLSAVTIYPIIHGVYLSLHRKLLIFGISEFVGLQNYRFLLTDERFWGALGNTVYFTVLSVSGELVLGLAFALLMNRAFHGKGFMRAVVLIPWAIPTVVSAKMWEWIYNGDFGILNYLLGMKINWLGDPFWALHAAIIMDVWKTTPFAAILLLAGLQLIPADLYSAARIDGAGSIRLFRHVTLPLLKPMILIVLIFRSLDAFRVFDAVYVLTGGGPANTTETLSVYAYKVLFQTLQIGYGSTLAVIVFLCVGFIAIGFMGLMGKRAGYR
jgi:trehalose/maltose transport system permease protein